MNQSDVFINHSLLITVVYRRKIICTLKLLLTQWLHFAHNMYCTGFIQMYTSLFQSELTTVERFCNDYIYNFIVSVNRTY